MKILKQNHNADFDFDLRQIKFKINLNDCKQDEKHSVGVLNKFLNSTVELKCHNRAMSTNNLFIEYEIEKNGIIQKSGIQLSKSDYYVFTVGNSMLSFESKFIKYIYQNKDVLINRYDGNGIMILKTDADNYIGIGVVVSLSIIWDLYNEWFRKNRLQDIEYNKQMEEVFRLLYPEDFV
jgi:hypothetical protein